MAYKRSIFENQELLSQIDSKSIDDDELHIKYGVIRNIYGMSESYHDINSSDTYELCREIKHCKLQCGESNYYTKGYIDTVDKYGRKVKKYCLNGRRRRYQQYIDAYCKYNGIV